MNLSVFIARILGLCYLVVGAGLVLNRKTFQQVLEDFCKNTALLFYGGVASLIFGITLILLHNIWVPHWIVIITIIGWLALIKGIWIIIFPNTVFKFMQIYQKNENLLMIQSIGVLIFGAVLTFLGFTVG